MSSFIRETVKIKLYLSLLITKIEMGNVLQRKDLRTIKLYNVFAVISKKYLFLQLKQITESETEFANGYKLKPDCAAVNAIDHKTQERNPVCTEYFTSEKSSLK